jgi:hypothetical protein
MAAMWRAVLFGLLCAGCDRVFGLGTVSRDVAVPVDPDLVAHYAMEDVVDNQVVDLARDHTAVCQSNCPTQTDGHSAGQHALQFDGSTQYLTIAGSDDTNFNMHTYTVAAWIRIDAKPLDSACMFGQTYETQRDNAWQLCIENDGALEFISTSGATYDDLLHAANVLNLGTWQHVAIVHSLTTKHLFYNGHDTDDRDVGAPVQTMPFTMYIGADVDFGSTVVAPFGGAIDEVRIYDRDLSAEEILELYGSSP